MSSWQEAQVPVTWVWSTRVAGLKRSREQGMQTFDQSLFDLYEANAVTYEDALRNADSVNDLRLQIKLNSQRAKNQDLASGTEHLSIV